MLLTSVWVGNYRSVINSEVFEIEPRKTLLVGVNEAGKTALLKALQQINPPAGIDRFDQLRDYPRSRYMEIQRGEKDPADVTVAHVEFTLSDDDKAKVLEESPSSTDVEKLVIWRNLDNSTGGNFGSAKHSVFLGEIEKDLARLRNYISKQEGGEEVATALDSVLVLRKATTKVTGKFAGHLRGWLDTAFPLIAEDDEAEEKRFDRIKSAVDLATQVNAAYAAMNQRLPLFVYYSTYFSVRPRINLASLATREESDDIDDEYDFGNLCLLRLLGFTARELSDLAIGEPRLQDYSNNAADEGFIEASRAHQKKLDDRQYRLNAASVDLTNSVREVWGVDDLKLRLIVDGQYLKVVVEDDLGVDIELDQRSEGFRWLVSFFVVFKAQASGKLKDAILLLDEPGLSLHALKQQEFRKTVSRLAEDNQVIYTTHSPFMVGSDELDLVRVVEMTDRTVGTKVHTRTAVDDPRSIYPLQAALGYELAQSLFGQKRNLVCEGITDMMFLEALHSAFDESGGGFKYEVAIVPAQSASKVIYYATVLLSQKLKVAALLDSDQAGEHAAAQDELVHLLTTKRILRTKEYTNNAGGKPEVEDLLRDSLIKIAKDDLGWDVTTTAQAQPNRPLVAIFKAEIADFSKYKLARGFIKWLGSHEISDLTQPERDGVTKLFKDINKALA